MVRRVMQEGGGICDAIQFLEELKKTNDGLDYRVKYDHRHFPVAICWMVPEMRQQLLCYRDVIFRCPKRDMNKPGWPYIGPSVRDSENQVTVLTESICIAETLEIYEWILLSMEAMEPRFSLKSVILLFADQFITQQLLKNLGMEETCVLHGDPYHLPSLEQGISREL
jgi:hypothetical protein